MNQQRNACERQREPAEKQARGPLAQEDPGRERDENGGEVGEQGGIRHRGELDRLVPEGEIAGECNRRGKEQRPVTGMTMYSRRAS